MLYGRPVEEFHLFDDKNIPFGLVLVPLTAIVVMGVVSEYCDVRAF